MKLLMMTFYILIFLGNIVSDEVIDNGDISGGGGDLIEFCEGLCRVIDIYSPAPPEEKIEEWPIEKRKDQLLIEKVENIMPQLFKKIEHPKFNIIRDKFISPLKDQITSLYIIDYKNNSFYSGYEKYINKIN